MKREDSITKAAATTVASQDRIEEHAADWLARRNGGLSAAERAEFDAWIARDSQHASALAAMEAAWDKLGALRQSGEAERMWAELAARRQQRVRRRRTTWSALGMAAALAVFSTIYFRAPEPAMIEPAAIASRPTTRTLADGSKVALRPGAVINVDFSAGFRRVLLVRGEALFSVTKDASRPFIVRSGNVEVRAVGTEFSVGQAADAVTVFVTEGRIAVAQTEEKTTLSSPSAAAPIFAVAGERVVVPASAPLGSPPMVSGVTSHEIAQALAWRGERLEFSGMPLSEAVRLINRGQRVQVVLAEPELGRRTITGVLWADDSEGFVRLLESGFNLTAERDGDVVRLRNQR
jgi:transmembrane sensor